MTKEQKLIQSYVAQLSEHFDSVQLFCTKKNEDGTIAIEDGSGNWYSRYGQVKAWIVKENRKLK